MKIPNKLKIGGHIYKVKIERISSDNDFDYGTISAPTNTIHINSNMPQTNKESTLIHEIFHAINTTISHELLDSLSEQFYQVLKDNKLLR